MAKALYLSAVFTITQSPAASEAHTADENLRCTCNGPVASSISALALKTKGFRFQCVGLPSRLDECLHSITMVHLKCLQERFLGA